MSQNDTFAVTRACSVLVVEDAMRRGAASNALASEHVREVFSLLDGQQVDRMLMYANRILFILEHARKVEPK